MATVPISADFGSPYAAVATVGYRVLGTDGTTVVARTTSGVVHLSQGKYAALATVPAGTRGVVWRCGGPRRSSPSSTEAPLVPRARKPVPPLVAAGPEALRRAGR